MTEKVKRGLGLVLVGILALGAGLLLTRMGATSDTVTQVSTALVLGAIIALSAGAVQIAMTLLRD